MVLLDMGLSIKSLHSFLSTPIPGELQTTDKKRVFD